MEKERIRKMHSNVQSNRYKDDKERDEKDRKFAFIYTNQCYICFNKKEEQNSVNENNSKKNVTDKERMIIIDLKNTLTNSNINNDNAGIETISL